METGIDIPRSYSAGVWGEAFRRMQKPLRAPQVTWERSATIYPVGTNIFGELSPWDGKQ